jgi:5-hydroxyisourate hydrolase
MSAITTHVLDVSRGRPAVGVGVQLELIDGDRWITLGTTATNSDGRAANLLASTDQLVAGDYRLTFATGDYFAKTSTRTLYPHVTITFEITNPDEHYHVPLLLSPYGYSTYRGS